MYRSTGIQENRCTTIKVYRYTSIPVHRYTGAQVYRYVSLQQLVYKYTSIQIYRSTGIQVYRYTGTAAAVPPLQGRQSRSKTGCCEQHGNKDGRADPPGCCWIRSRVNSGRAARAYMLVYILIHLYIYAHACMSARSLRRWARMVTIVRSTNEY